MQFKDVEVGQRFVFVNGQAVYEKVSRQNDNYNAKYVGSSENVLMPFRFFNDSLEVELADAPPFVVKMITIEGDVYRALTTGLRLDLLNLRFIVEKLETQDNFVVFGPEILSPGTWHIVARRDTLRKTVHVCYKEMN